MINALYSLKNNQKRETVSCFLVDTSTNRGWITLIHDISGDYYQKEMNKFYTK